jgi:flagellar biogenesis protein FliO
VTSATAAGASGTATSELVLLGRVTLSLLVVLVLAVLAGRLARRTRLGSGQSTIRVHSRVSLTREAGVAVVEVAGQVMVLGITPTSVTLLTTVEPAALAAESLVSEPPSWGSRARPPARWAPGQLLESLRQRTVRRSP